MTKTYKVKVNLLDDSVDKIVYNDNNEEKSTDTIYFRKINIADLTEAESDRFYEIIDKIAVLKQQEIEKKQQKLLENPEILKIIEEQSKEATKKLEELKKQRKKEENKTDAEIEEEDDIDYFLGSDEDLRGYGISTKDVMNFAQPLIEKFVFLDEGCKLPINTSNNIIRQLGNGYIKANYFLLAISVL